MLSYHYLQNQQFCKCMPSSERVHTSKSQRQDRQNIDLKLAVLNSCTSKILFVPDRSVMLFFNIKI